MEDHCYFWSSGTKIWDEAEEYRREKKGHLASVTNQEIHNHIRSKVDNWKDHKTMFWVGGRYKGNIWSWADGKSWEFTKWGTDQPDNAGTENCLQIDTIENQDGWNDQSCEAPRKFVCSLQHCSDNNNNNNNDNNKNNNSNNNNSTNDADATNTKHNNTSDINKSANSPVVGIAVPSGVLLIVRIIAVTCCVIRKRANKKPEETNLDLNPVYGVYQLTETYERQYSTNEAVDNNDYYEQ